MMDSVYSFYYQYVSLEKFYPNSVFKFKLIFISTFLIYSVPSISCFFFFLFLKQAPKIVPFKPEHKTGHLGKTLKVLCYLESGDESFQFEWHKNGQQLSTKNNYRFGINSVDDLSSLLTIHSLTSDDNGNYSCYVHNQFGHDIQSFSLNVKGLLWPNIFFF